MKDPTPFREPLERSEVNPTKFDLRLQELRSAPDKVVRFQDLEWVRPDNARFAGMTDIREVASTGKRLFAEFGDRYGIPAQVDFVIGKDENNFVGIYGIQDKIIGSDLREDAFTADRAVALRESTTLYDTLIRYYEDKYTTQDYFLNDIARNEQFMYGRAPGENEPRLHLVDVDILFSNTPDGLEKPLVDLIKSIRKMEGRLGVVYTDQRAAIGRFAERIQAEHPSALMDSVLHYLHQ